MIYTQKIKNQQMKDAITVIYNKVNTTRLNNGTVDFIGYKGVYSHIRDVMSITGLDRPSAIEYVIKHETWKELV